MRILVTGGAGFIGYWIWKKLIEENHEVKLIDNLSRTPSWRVNKIREEGGELDVVDIRDLESLKKIFKKFSPDAVIHLAALIDVKESIEKPALYMEVNALGTANVVEASLEAEVDRIIYTSSAAVYGNPKYLPIDEEHPTEPISPYGASKLAGEQIIKSTQASRGKPEYVILRLFNVYGPGQDPSSPYAGVVSKFMDKILRGEPPIIFGDGKQTRDFIHVWDVANAIIKSLRTKAKNFVCNIAYGEPVSIEKLAELLIRQYGSTETTPVHAPSRPGEITHSYASIKRATELLNWRPSISLSSMKHTYK